MTKKSRFMHFTLLLVVTAGLVVMPACGTIQSLKEGAAVIAANQQEIKQTVANVKEITEIAKAGVVNASAEVKEAVAEFKKINEAALAKADTNKSGDIDGIGEWLQYLILLVAGGSGYAASKMRQGSVATKQKLEELEAKLKG